MKVTQIDAYPCGEQKTYPRYEFWGLAYTPNSGKPGCPKHGYRCRTKPTGPLACSDDGKHFFAWRDHKPCPVCGKEPPKEE